MVRLSLVKNYMTQWVHKETISIQQSTNKYFLDNILLKFQNHSTLINWDLYFKDTKLPIFCMLLLLLLLLSHFSHV